MPVVAARVGKEALAAEAVRSHIDGWFWDAAATSGVRPVGAPEVEWDDPPRASGDVQVPGDGAGRAAAEARRTWTTLEVGEATAVRCRASSSTRELERMRDAGAELVPASADGRSEAGDTLVLDLVGEGGGEGAVRAPRLRRRARGSAVSPTSSRTRSRACRRAGRRRSSSSSTREQRAPSTVTVKEIKEKVLPELDDELAASLSEFETLAELRADIEARLKEQLEAELEARFRAGRARRRRRADRRSRGSSRSSSAAPPRCSRPSRGRSSRRASSAERLSRRRPGRRPRRCRRARVPRRSARSSASSCSRRSSAKLGHRGRRRGDRGADPRGGRARRARTPTRPSQAMRERGGFEQIRGDLRLRKALDEIVARRQEDPGGAGAGAREALDTREGEGRLAA